MHEYEKRRRKRDWVRAGAISFPGKFIQQKKFSVQTALRLAVGEDYGHSRETKSLESGSLEVSGRVSCLVEIERMRDLVGIVRLPSWNRFSTDPAEPVPAGNRHAKSAFEAYTFSRTLSLSGGGVSVRGSTGLAVICRFRFSISGSFNVST